MNLRLLSIVLFAFLGTTFIACQGNSGETTSEGTATEQEAQPSAAQPAEREKGARMPGISAVAWSELQALVPNTAAGLPRTNAGEDKSDLGDLGFSHALGVYDQGDRHVEVQLLDCGSQKTILSTIAPWFGKNVEEQQKSGFEMTTTVNGFPAIERMDKMESTSEIGVVIKDRFVVMVVGKNVPLEDLRKVMDGLDLKKLENLSN